MTNQRKVGRWASLFGQRMSFQKEIASAKEIGVRWTQIGDENYGQLDVEIDPIPGWLTPMWGSDDQWLYLRRPEGVWKFALPNNNPNHSVQLCFRNQDGQSLGSDSIGTEIRSLGGWFWSMDTHTPINAADIDDEVQGWAEEDRAPADQLGGYLDQIVEVKPGMTMIQVGDEFGQPPLFSTDGDWLVATDQQGWRVAYSLRNCSKAKAALDQKELWLLFSGPCMKSWSTRVELGSFAEQST